MKPATAILVLAGAVMAVPTNNDPNNRCNNNDNHTNYVCCGGLLGLLCVVNLLGGSCNGGSYCCESPQTGLININLLNCLKL